MSKYLEGLNPSQDRAVRAIEGSIQINAVAGSGKTRVLTHRIGYMLENHIKPNSMLCTTFTKKATEEMMGRLKKLIKPMQLAQMTIGTSHSIGYKILAKEYAALNHRLASAFKKRDGVLMNYSLKKFGEEVIKSIMMDRTVQMGVKEELRDMPVAGLLKAVANAKNEGLDPYQFEASNSSNGGDRAEAYIEFYKRYEKKKWDEALVDGDDLLFLLVRLFQEHPEVLEKYQRIYKYLLVDEAQDNNTLQYQLFEMLAYPENNIFLVGDDDQSMYNFRGARPDLFINFSKEFKNVIQIPLEDNYRSKPKILQVANKLISKNTVRLLKKLKPHREDDSECVSYSKYDSESGEAQGTAQEIKELVEKEGIPYKKISILYRVNAQSRALEDALIVAGMPYVIHGGVSFYERKEVKDILAYLELVLDTTYDESFKRVINVPSRYLGKAFLAKVEAYDGSHYEAIKGNHVDLKGYEKTNSLAFINIIEQLRQMNSEGCPPIELINFIMSEEGAKYEKYLTDDGEEEEGDDSRMENIATLKYVLDRYTTLKEFMAYIRLMTTTAKHSIDGVQLMTIHKSKGLEFPVCFAVGCNEGTLPHFKSIESEKDGKPLAIEEERRLLYVAITRAEDSVYMSSSGSYNGRPCKPSRFIKDMELRGQHIPDVPQAKAVGDTRLRTPIIINKGNKEGIIKELFGSGYGGGGDDYNPMSIYYNNV
jgi:DNA helicase-2/ATP-dependent DNA helicase PcrA